MVISKECKASLAPLSIKYLRSLVIYLMIKGCLRLMVKRKKKGSRDIKKRRIAIMRARVCHIMRHLTSIRYTKF